MYIFTSLVDDKIRIYTSIDKLVIFLDELGSYRIVKYKASKIQNAKN